MLISLFALGESELAKKATGRTFYVSRAYRSHQQAVAFQFMLDRLSALSLIDWGRRFDLIAVSVR